MTNFIDLTADSDDEDAPPPQRAAQPSPRYRPSASTSTPRFPSSKASTSGSLGEGKEKGKVPSNGASGSGREASSTASPNSRLPSSSLSGPARTSKGKGREMIEDRFVGTSSKQSDVIVISDDEDDDSFVPQQGSSRQLKSQNTPRPPPPVPDPSASTDLHPTPKSSAPPPRPKVAQSSLSVIHIDDDDDDDASPKPEAALSPVKVVEPLFPSATDHAEGVQRDEVSDESSTPHSPPSAPNTPTPKEASTPKETSPFGDSLMDSSNTLPSSHTSPTQVKINSSPLRQPSPTSTSKAPSPAPSAASSGVAVQAMLQRVVEVSQTETEEIIEASTQSGGDSRATSPYADDGWHSRNRGTPVASVSAFTAEQKGKGRAREVEMETLGDEGPFVKTVRIAPNVTTYHRRKRLVEEAFADDEVEPRFLVKKKVRTETYAALASTSRQVVSIKSEKKISHSLVNESLLRPSRKRRNVYLYLSVNERNSKHQPLFDPTDKGKRYALCIEAEELRPKVVDFPNTFLVDQQEFEADGKPTSLTSNVRPVRPPSTAFTSTNRYQDMINEANERELYNKFKIRLVPSPHDGAPKAPASITYTNRIIYPKNTIPQPAPGCDCKSDCQEPSQRSSCSCRSRQRMAAANLRSGATRSGKTTGLGLAYVDEGVRNPDIQDDPVMECSYLCGCPPSCWNRSASKGTNIRIDIFWTGIRGWGIRLAPEADAIEAGTHLGVYAGELIRANEATRREDLLTENTCNYLYDLDFWHVKEDLDFASLQRRDEKASWSMDAASYGNHTRFANHSCVPNVIPRAVYIDDATLDRPLLAFTSSRMIFPGEEIVISYYSSNDPRLKPGQSLAEYKAAADKTRGEAKRSHRCYCEQELCRGVMFEVKT